MKKNDESYYNLIDVCLQFDEDIHLTGNPVEIFRRILAEYFFKQEVYESKRMENYFKRFELPSLFQGASSLMEIDVERIKEFIEGQSLSHSLAGTVYTSTEYLKSFYPHHPPSFSKLPAEVRDELITKIKTKNQQITDAFDKMVMDRQAARSRKVLTLIALILKNIHLTTGLAFRQLSQSTEELIRSIFSNCDEPFLGQQKQLADLTDTRKIRDVLAVFFEIGRNQNITELIDFFKSEVDRYRRRALRA